MFILREDKSQKIPEVTSIFFKFFSLPKELFDNLIQIENSCYEHKLKEFEFTINSLSTLVNILINYDDVKFIPAKEHTEDICHNLDTSIFK